jgi:hypothetical protein
VVVISPWKRRKHAAAKAAQDAFIDECGAVLDPLLAPLGFHAGHPSYSLNLDEMFLFYEPEDEEFLSRYPGAGVEVIEAGGVELWVTFHRSSGTFEAQCTAGDFYMDDRDVPGSPDWRVDVEPVLLAIADGLSEDLQRLRDENASDTNPRTRPLRERRGGSRLRRAR